MSLARPDVPTAHDYHYWAKYGTTWLALCTEEILLAILVAEIRKNLEQQIRAIFCCCNRRTHNNQ
jgi:hypothetical protein